MEGPRLLIVFILLFFIWSSPNKRVISFDTEAEDLRLNLRKNETFVSLINSTYGNLLDPVIGLNLTGFRSNDGLHWEVLPQAFDLTRKQHVENWASVDEDASIYRTINGEIRGSYQFLHLPNLDLNKTVNLTLLDPGAEYFSTVYDRNITDSTGIVIIDLEAVDSDRSSNHELNEIKAAVTLSGNGTAPLYVSNVLLRGLHNPTTGAVVLTTWSRKFNALPALPHLLTDGTLFTNATNVINETLAKVWSLPQDPSDTLIASPSCELVVWLTPKPLLASQLYIDAIEAELKFPEGAPIGQPPLLVYSAVVFSPDCGYILAADTLSGPKNEVWSTLLRKVLLALILTLVGQIIVLKRQVRRTSTPSTRARVSYHSIAMGALGNGMIFFTMIFLVSWTSSVYLLSGIGALSSILLMGILELKFMLDCWTVQVAEPAERERERRSREAGTVANTTTLNAQTSDTTAPPTEVANTLNTRILTQPPPPSSAAVVPASTPVLSAAGLPIPATASNPTTSPTTATATGTITTTTTNAEPRTTFSSLYTKFYLTLLFLTFTTIWSSTWPPNLQTAYTTLTLTAYFSLWLPQIHRNLQRNCRKALTWEFVLASSALRLLPALYLLLTPHNIFFTTLRPRLAVFLTLWLSTQLAILAAQEFLGPRFGMPKHWFVDAYDYHPVLSADLESATTTSTSASSLLSAGGAIAVAVVGGKESTDKERKVFDCAICMNEVSVPVVRSTASNEINGSLQSLVERRKYMITPCRHVFHTSCLEGWLDLRLVCPVCRETLPPV